MSDLNRWLPGEDGRIYAVYSHHPVYAKSKADAEYLCKCHNHTLELLAEERGEKAKKLHDRIAELEKRLDDICFFSATQWGGMEWMEKRITAIAEGECDEEEGNESAEY